MHSDKEEIWLWNEVRYGNDKAFHQLYTRHYDHLYRYGLHVSRNRPLVMDCINEVFAGIWARRRELPEVQQVSGYLFVVFKRHIAHAMEKEPGSGPLPLEKNFTPRQDTDSYEALLIASQTEEEMKARVRQALDKLTPRQKELIRLRYYEGLPMEAIADTKHITLRTIYNTLHTAIGLLRRELQGRPARERITETSAGEPLS